MQEVTDNIIEFLNPKFVFLPIDGYRLKVKDGEYIYKNSIVAMSKNDEILYSSISGRVLGVKDMLTAEEKIKSCLVIENDFKENVKVKKSANKYINRISREDFYSRLEDSSLKIKDSLVLDKIKKIDNVLVINTMDSDPDFLNNAQIMKNNAEDILEGIDLIARIQNAHKVYLVLKNTDNEVIKATTEIIGTYPNIEVKLVNGEYPNTLPEMIVKNLEIEDAVVLDAEEIYSIYEVLRREIPASEKLVTVVGNGISKNAIMRIKIGSLFAEAFVSNFDFSAKNVDVFINGTHRGTKASTLKYVVDSSFEGVTILKSEGIKEEACINCGLCSKKCPMKLNPKYVFDHAGNVKDEYKDKCIQCGLCNMVCPSNIDLKKYMRMEDNYD